MLLFVPSFARNQVFFWIRGFCELPVKNEIFIAFMVTFVLGRFVAFDATFPVTYKLYLCVNIYFL